MIHVEMVKSSTTIAILSSSSCEQFFSQLYMSGRRAWRVSGVMKSKREEKEFLLQSSWNLMLRIYSSLSLSLFLSPPLSLFIITPSSEWKKNRQRMSAREREMAVKMGEILLRIMKIVCVNKKGAAAAARGWNGIKFVKLLDNSDYFLHALLSLFRSLARCPSPLTLSRIIRHNAPSFLPDT